MAAWRFAEHIGLYLEKKSSGKSVFEILASVVYYLNRYDTDKV